MNIETLKSNIETQLLKTRENGSVANMQKLKDLRGELGAELAQGAKPCPTCGSDPFGMEQPVGVPGVGVITLYEVGCLVCTGDDQKRSKGQTQKQAVEKWNKGEYLPKNK